MPTRLRSDQRLSRLRPHIPQGLPELPGWRVLECVESDAWTSTYRATAASGDGQFAILAVRSDLAGEPDRQFAVGLIARAAEVAATVSHRRLLPVFSAHVGPSEAWLVQPYLPAEPLPDTAALPQKLWTVRQAAEALAALHEARWLHGAVAPGSIRVAASGHATLGQLGWARRLQSDECDLRVARFAGQVRYAAPEMFDDSGRLTAAADVYALGAILLELLSGQPFLGQYDGAELVAAKRMLAAVDGVPLPADTPYSVINLTGRMLQRDPLRRPTIGEVIESLVASEIEALPRWKPGA